MGIGRYRAYSLTLLLESIAGVITMALLVPRFGLVGGVAGITALIAVARWFMLSHFFAKEFQIHQGRYLWDIFQKPLILIAASAGALSLLHRVWSGRTFLEIVLTLVAFAACYSTAALFFIVEKDQRAWLFAKAKSLY